MTPVEVIDQFRSDVADQSIPYLFSDDEVFRWLVDAQDQFVRGIGGFADAFTQALTDVPVVTNEPWAPISPYVLRIKSARLLTAKTVVTFIHENDLELERTKDYGFITWQGLDDTDTGVVSHGILELTDNKIRWYKVPLTDDTCRMHVYRLPFPRLVDLEGCLEIDEFHHLSLILWMKHKAYSKEDAETYDSELADKNEKKFEDYVEKSRKELERKRFKPKQVRYGGIPF